ncbi:TPA: histidine--tRNA ligase, partial [Patescibacteria group bacterium]|nr:histidine--tRNA ligase [Patescibacteria group bacterium]
PGTGFGLGFDRTLEAAEALNLIPKQSTNSQVLVTIFSEQLQPQSLKIATQLREGGINTELFPEQTAKLDKQLKYADRKGIPYVIIVGDNEIKQNKVLLKNMQTKSQELLTIIEVISKLE